MNSLPLLQKIFFFIYFELRYIYRKNLHETYQDIHDVNMNVYVYLLMTLICLCINDANMFILASISKSITMAVLARLVEEDKVDLGSSSK